VSPSHKDDPKIVTHGIPEIHIYKVTGDELRRLEEGEARGSHDLTLACTLFSACVALVLALATGSFSERWHELFIGLAIACGVGTLTAGRRWYKARKNVSPIIAGIRSRSVDPEG